MAGIDRMHALTQNLRFIIDKYDRSIAEEYDSEELREILHKLFIHLSSHEGFAKALANADAHDRNHEEWSRDLMKERVKNIMYEIESLTY